MIAQTVVPVLRRWDPARKLPSRAPILVVVGADDNLFCTGVTVYNCASLRRCAPLNRSSTHPQRT
jgi:hypothetical protein